MGTSVSTFSVTDYAIRINHALHDGSIDSHTALEKLVSVIPNTYCKKYDDREFNLRVGKDIASLYPYFCRADHVYIRCYWSSEYDMDWIDLVEYLVTTGIGDRIMIEVNA